MFSWLLIINDIFCEVYLHNISGIITGDVFFNFNWEWYTYELFTELDGTKELVVSTKTKVIVTYKYKKVSFVMDKILGHLGSILLIILMILFGFGGEED